MENIKLLAIHYIWKFTLTQLTTNQQESKCWQYVRGPEYKWKAYRGKIEKLFYLNILVSKYI